MGSTILAVNRTNVMAWIAILRPHLALAAVICAVVGYVLAASSGVVFLDMALVAAAVFGIAGGTMPLNDVIDAQADRVNRPTRPIPSGRIRVRHALLLFLLFSAGALLAAWKLGTMAFVLALGLFAVSVVYNLLGKQWGFLGNTLVSSCVAGTFLFGAVSAGGLLPQRIFLLSAVAFLASLALETAGDLLDASGDKAAGSRSVAAARGYLAARRIYVTLIVLLLLAAAGMPLALHGVPLRVLWITLPGATIFAALGARFLHVALRIEIASTRTKAGTRIVLTQAWVLTMWAIAVAFL